VISLSRHLLQVIVLGLGIQACTTLDHQPTNESPAVSQILVEAPETASGITDLHFNIDGLESVAIFQALVHDFKSAQETATSIRDNGSRDQTLAQIGGIMARLGDLRSAHAIAARLPNGRDKELLKGRIASAVATSGDHSDALRLASQLDDEAIRAFVLLDLIAQMTKSNDFASAEKTAGLLPDPIESKPIATYSLERPNRSRAYAHIAERLAQQHLMSEALRVAQLIRDPVEQGLAVKALVQFSLEHDNVRQAWEILRTFSNDQAQTCGLIHLAMHYARKGDIANGLETAYAIGGGSESSIRCTHLPRATISLGLHVRQSLVLMAAVTGGHVSSALLAAEEFPTEEDRSLGITSIAIAQARIGDPAGALKTLSHYQIEHSDEALKEVALAYAKLPMRAESFQASNRIKSDELREKTRGQMVFRLAEAGETDGALEILLALPNERNKRHAFSAIADAQAARRHPNEALDTVRLIDDKHDRDIAIGKIATVSARTANAQETLSSEGPHNSV
jgi:hypothetical protein